MSVKICLFDQLKSYLNKTRISDKSEECIFTAVNKGKRQCLQNQFPTPEIEKLLLKLLKL